MLKTVFRYRRVEVLAALILVVVVGATGVLGLSHTARAAQARTNLGAWLVGAWQVEVSFVTLNGQPTTIIPQEG